MSSSCAVYALCLCISSLCMFCFCVVHVLLMICVGFEYVSFVYDLGSAYDLLMHCSSIVFVSLV